MSRVDQFYKKYNLETPEEKKAREEAELKAKKKEARKAKKAVKKQVAEQIGDFTGITKNQEGIVIQKMSDERNAEKTPYEHLDEVIAKYNLPVANDYVAVDMGFLNKLAEDTKLNIQEEVEVEMMENFKAILNEVLDARETKNRELDLAMAKETTRQLELQLELARLNAATPTEPVVFELESFMPVTTEGKLEEVIEEHTAAVETILDAIQVAEKPTKKTRKATIKKKGESKLTLSTMFTPLNKGRSGYSVAWSKVPNDDAGFMNIIIPIVEFAMDNGIDVKDTNAFREFHPVCQGAYIQYTKRNPGRKGVWKEFINKYFSK